MRQNSGRGYFFRLSGLSGD